MSRAFASSRWRKAATPLLLVLVWQGLAWAGLISPEVLPSPLAIAHTFWRLTASGELPHHLVVSLARAASGLLIGIAVGGTLALMAGLSTQGEDIVDATVQMLRTLPHLAIVPLFILWFGIGETPKIALVALGVTFAIYINLFSGIRHVDAKIVEAARTLGATRREMIRHIILPGALPSALVGLRLAVGTAWLSLVVGEQINATSGIGFLIMDAREFMQTDVIFVGLIVYALLGLSTDMLIRYLDRRVFAWRPSFVRH
ncbi:ABC transporter permease [Achromobacter marplatensis]